LFNREIARFRLGGSARLGALYSTDHGRSTVRSQLESCAVPDSIGSGRQASSRGAAFIEICAEFV
jgi:hypothetical protein